MVAKFKTEDEVIKRANDSIYGLGAGVFSNDAKQVMRVAGELLAGSVWVNQVRNSGQLPNKEALELTRTST